MLAIFTCLGEDPADASEGRIDGEEDHSSRIVIDGDEGWGSDDCLLELLHGLVVLVLPNEVNVLSREVNKGLSEV